MNNPTDTKRLSEAVNNIAVVITEIIEAKIKELFNRTKAEDSLDAFSRLTPAEGWVGKREMAEHLKISLRTLDTWMKKGIIPHIRIGRGIRFKLSDVDEAVNRRLGIQSRY